MKWMMSVMTAVMMFVSVGAAHAADAPSCDAKTSPIANQQDADKRCPSICTQAGYDKWNGQWTNTPPSGAGPVCGCVVKPSDSKTTPIANQSDADKRCPSVCKAANGLWNGQWTNTPPSRVGPVCGCYQMKAADVKTTPLSNQQDADKRCPSVCSGAKATWNGQWTNTPPSGAGPVCGCLTPACG
ncbi:mannan-binding protein [Archangium sp.]|uniref:mannan-binding protein n=1 Tax=Archangium sp. TaxID=1872627 RepID=UPI003899EC83